MTERGYDEPLLEPDNRLEAFLKSTGMTEVVKREPTLLLQAFLKATDMEAMAWVGLNGELPVLWINKGSLALKMPRKDRMKEIRIVPWENITKLLLDKP